jgi:predicted nucleic acid-binding protein
VLVIDASVAVNACLAAEGFAHYQDPNLVAPALMWSEARSALHELVWRGALEPGRGSGAHAHLIQAPVERREDDSLGAEAWRIADQLGWARTYDAEYVALASLLGCRLVTLDARLRRATDRLGFVVSPTEL